jgi:hypothetical protein
MTITTAITFIDINGQMRQQSDYQTTAKEMKLKFKKEMAVTKKRNLD